MVSLSILTSTEYYPKGKPGANSKTSHDKDNHVQYNTHDNEVEETTVPQNVRMDPQEATVTPMTKAQFLKDPMTTSDLTTSPAPSSPLLGSPSSSCSRSLRSTTSFSDFYELYDSEDEQDYSPRLTLDEPEPSSSTAVSQIQTFFLPENIQAFLATVADLPPSQYPHFKLGIRHPLSEDVSRLNLLLERGRLSLADLSEVHPNAVVSLIKEVLSSLPALFPEEEFVCLPMDCNEELALCYLQGLICGLCQSGTLLAVLVARAFSRVIVLAGSTTQALTDTVMMLSPLLFPRCSCRPDSFIRASRATLLFIQQHELLFKRAQVDVFLVEILSRLNRLHESIIDSDSEDDASEENADSPVNLLSASKLSHSFYTLTYE